MKRIAIGLSLYLIILTNISYGKVLDSIDANYKQTQSLIEKLLGQKITDSYDLQAYLSNLSQENKPTDEMKVAGGVDSGGGSLVQTTTTTGLLDLYLYNRQAFDSKEKGFILPETPSYQDHGFEALINSNSSLISESIAHIEKWKKSSPIIFKFATDALKKLPIYYVKSKLIFKDQMAFTPSDTKISRETLRQVAHYIQGIGVFVEKESFDHLSRPNQIGLLIHEALRHQQLNFESGMSNENLQKLTALLLSEPQQGASLDLAPYLSGTLLKNIIFLADLRIMAKIMMVNLCKEWSETCYLELLSREEILNLSNETLNNFIFVNSTQEKTNQEKKLLRRLNELKRNLRSQFFLEDASGVKLQNLAFLLGKEYTNILRIAMLAKIYNEKPEEAQQESEALRNFIRSLHEIGVLTN